MNSSPADGAPESPSIPAGIEGLALLNKRPFSSNNARTRPNSVPANKISPLFKIPCCTNIVAMTPRPLSSVASITVPRAKPVRGALSSIISACNKIASNSSSIPCPVLDETSTNILSPPHDSETMSCWASSDFIFSLSVPSLSILVSAIMTGILAARACLIASMVCGITPSSAATTKTAISVTSVPRARIAEKAAWPGVSRKVITPLSVCA